MICQYKGNELCPNCVQCEKPIFFDIYEQNNTNKLIFNFFGILNKNKIDGNYFYISESFLSKFVDLYNHEKNKMIRLDDLWVYLMSNNKSSDFEIESAKLSLKKVKTDFTFFKNLNKFDKFQKIILQNNNDTSPRIESNCKSSVIISIKLESDDFKYIMDSKLPKTQEMIIITSNVCPKETFDYDTKIIAKSIYMVLFFSFFQTFIFSLFNQVDVMGLVIHVFNKNDSFFDSLISAFSKFDCSKDLVYTDFEESMSSNNKILILFGIRQEPFQPEGRDFFTFNSRRK